MDVYMQPLVDEFKMLWEEGMKIVDASNTPLEEFQVNTHENMCTFKKKSHFIILAFDKFATIVIKVIKQTKVQLIFSQY